MPSDAQRAPAVWWHGGAPLPRSFLGTAAGLRAKWPHRVSQNGCRDHCPGIPHPLQQPLGKFHCHWTSNELVQFGGAVAFRGRDQCTAPDVTSRLYMSHRVSQNECSEHRLGNPLPLQQLLGRHYCHWMCNLFLYFGTTAAFHRRDHCSAPLAACREYSRIGSPRLNATTIVLAFRPVAAGV